MFDGRPLVVSGLCALARRKDDVQVPVGKYVARVIYSMWERGDGYPLPDDLRYLIHATALQADELEPASKVVLDIERRAVDGVPPATLTPKQALLAVALIANDKFYRDAYDWTLTVNQNEESKNEIRRRERRYLPGQGDS